MKIETINQLDKALNFLFERNTTYYSHDKLKKECFNNDSKIDVEAIVSKLKNDGSLHYGLLDTNKTDFKISIDGSILKERGGYVAKHKREWFQRHAFVEKVILIFIGAMIGLLSSLLTFKLTKHPPRLKQEQEHPAKTNSNVSLPTSQINKKDSSNHN